jgi:TolB protein
MGLDMLAELILPGAGISVASALATTSVVDPTPVLPEQFLLSSTTSLLPTPEILATGTAVFSTLFASATPSFSLSNSQIVYVCHVKGSDEICLMRGDGSDIRQLTSAPVTDWYPSLSPDGGTIVFSSQSSGRFEISRMNTDGDHLVQLTHGIGDAFAPEISPDGTKIVFAASVNDVQNIWGMNVDGSNVHQLTFLQRDAIDPSWSPDGLYISFTSSVRGSGDLMIMSMDGSNVRRVTDGINVEGRNDWSPDGRLLTFYAGPQGDKDIYLAEATCASQIGGCKPDQMHKLTDGGNNKGPSFSPDGEWIAFASQLAGFNQIFIIRVDGAQIYQLTDAPYANWQPRWSANFP